MPFITFLLKQRGRPQESTKQENGLDSYEEKRSGVETRLDRANLVVHLRPSSPSGCSLCHCHVLVISLPIHHLQGANALYHVRFQDFTLSGSCFPCNFLAFEPAHRWGVARLLVFILTAGAAREAGVGSWGGGVPVGRGAPAGGAACAGVLPVFFSV